MKPRWTTPPYLVGEPELPSHDDFSVATQKIWRSKQLSNFGYYEKKFSSALCGYLNAEHVILFSNGTSALEALLAAFGNGSDVYLPAFSFIASLTAVNRIGLLPKFVDVSLRDGTLDIHCLNMAQIKRNDIILGVHCYSYPCDVEAIYNLSKHKGADVIYDAAHCFGARFENRNLTEYGLASILSFHATKILSSIEGGAVVTNDKNLAQEVDTYRNFGFNVDKKRTSGIGINAKMSEVHAAFGLAALNNFDSVLSSRTIIYEGYRKALENVDGVRFLTPRAGASPNGSYVPLEILGGKKVRDSLQKYLASHNIFARPYFNIDLSSVASVNTHPRFLLNTKKLCDGALCLPIHSRMSQSDINFISNKIGEFLHDKPEK